MRSLTSNWYPTSLLKEALALLEEEDMKAYFTLRARIHLLYILSSIFTLNYWLFFSFLIPTKSGIKMTGSGGQWGWVAPEEGWPASRRNGVLFQSVFAMFVQPCHCPAWLNPPGFFRGSWKSGFFWTDCDIFSIKKILCWLNKTCLIELFSAPKKIFLKNVF